MPQFEIKELNLGLNQVLMDLAIWNIAEDSRNGPVLRFPEPTTIKYTDPCRRLLTNPVRDANPFFHLFETMWMFAGMNQIEPLLLFNPNMMQYSDDSKVLRGTAYGHRWRREWGDQLLEVVRQLTENPSSRQIVMSMWNPTDLFLKNSKDFACNLQVLFSTRPTENEILGRRILDMTVTNRSNDIVYGALGSNVFHFSMLLEYVAFHSGLLVGNYYQIANNLHLYTENEVSRRCYSAREELPRLSPSADHSLTEFGLSLDKEYIRNYVLTHDTESLTKGDYLHAVVNPLVRAYKCFKNTEVDAVDRIMSAQEMAEYCNSKPLRINCIEWLDRRLARRLGK